MKLVTAQQMRSLDRAAIVDYGIASLTLMERAGIAVADTAERIARGRKGSVVVVCGRGNNGGDGFVAARLLLERGLDVAVFVLARMSEIAPDARANWERLAPLTTRMYEILSWEDLTPHHPLIAGAAVVIDAILGTGLERSADGLLLKVIDYLNAIRRPIVAIDVPSGLSADTGLPLGAALHARTTVTLGLPKMGLYIGRGADHAGEVIIADIGIPHAACERLSVTTNLTDAGLVVGLLKPRARASHKGTHGHVAVIAGSAGKLGAGYLASMAALRVGAGLATYVLPEAAFAKFDARYPEIMCMGLVDRGRGHFHTDGIGALAVSLKGIAAVALGPAIGTHGETRAFQRELVPHLTAPLVIDADGLNNLDIAQIARRQQPAVLTPHPGEFSRLTGIDAADIREHRLERARSFAVESHAVVVLKGQHTIVALPDGTAYINTTGNPAMASAGMGDALTGVVAGLMAQGLDPANAAILGVFVHGSAGDRAAVEIGDRGVVASDVIRRLPAALQSLTSREDLCR